MHCRDLYSLDLLSSLTGLMLTRQFDI